MTERRAGKYLVDLFINGVVTPIQVYLKANILEPIRPVLILPEVVDESKWWEGKHHYADPEGKYIFVFQGNVHGGENSYNTKAVNPKELKSYWDFLDPKWKGKIVAYDPSRVSNVAHSLRFLTIIPTSAGICQAIVSVRWNSPIQRDERQMIDWLGAGKYAIAFLSAKSKRLRSKDCRSRLRTWPIQRRRFVGPVQGGVNLSRTRPIPTRRKLRSIGCCRARDKRLTKKYSPRWATVRQSMREDIAMECYPASHGARKACAIFIASR
jgi:hypothetical protein